jgi:glutamate racemase
MIITQSSDPTIWASLEVRRGNAGWVILGTTHYMVITMVNGEIGYVARTPRELVDSRSITRSKAASYTKLDEE